MNAHACSHDETTFLHNNESRPGIRLLALGAARAAGQGPGGAAARRGRKLEEEKTEVTDLEPTGISHESRSSNFR